MAEFIVWTYPFFPVFSCIFLQKQNKSTINLSLLYPGVLEQKLNPFSKTEFSDGEGCFSDMLNMFESSVFLDVRDGFFINDRSS